MFHASDRVLVAICRAKPADVEELLEVPGIGPTVARKYGKDIIKLVGAAR